MTLPASLLEHMSVVVPGFATEEPNDQWCLARMLWACAEGSREHKLWPDMYSLSMRRIRRIWGDDARMREVVAFKYFTVYQGGNLSEATNAYAPSIEMAEALVRCISSQTPEEWVDSDGRPWIPTGNAIASMAAPPKNGTGRRQTKWKGAEPAKFVPISIEALQAYREDVIIAIQGRDLVEPAAAWVRREIRCIDSAAKMARNARSPGSIPIKYREGSTGRITAQGHSLQSMPRWVRSAALVGKWDYDISTCQWQILSQMAARMGIDCPLTNAYIADKRLLRRRVSEGAEISLDDAKMCITALMFGAVVQRSPMAMRLHPNDLVRVIGIPAALRLCKQPDFMSLYEEIGTVGRDIVKAHPRSNGRLINDLRITYLPETETETKAKAKAKAKASHREQLAHLLQGAEAAALRAVVRQHQHQILLCMHDGWVTAEPLEVSALSEQIARETGYRFTIEVERLEAPTRDQIKGKLDDFEAFSEGELKFKDPFAVAQGSHVFGGDRPGAADSAFDGTTVDPRNLASLWTRHPHPAQPVLARLAFVSPRPRWNLPPGSTAACVDSKRQEAARTSATQAAD